MYALSKVRVFLNFSEGFRGASINFSGGFRGAPINFSGGFRVCLENCSEGFRGRIICFYCCRRFDYYCFPRVFVSGIGAQFYFCFPSFQKGHLAISAGACEDHRSRKIMSATPASLHPYVFPDSVPPYPVTIQLFVRMLAC